MSLEAGVRPQAQLATTEEPQREAPRYPLSVTLGRFSGTDPDSGKSYDEPDIAIADADSGDESAVTVSGRAEDLDCWLWHRPSLEPLRHSGDQDVLAAFEATIAAGIN